MSDAPRQPRSAKRPSPAGGRGSTDPDAPPRAPTARGPLTFPVVGIGASAGGLEAVSRLLGALPLDTGLAFVFVQHLEPSHESVLPELLARATRLPVGGIKNGERIAPNHVYVIPPNAVLSVKRGRLRLARRPAGQHRPIDDFLRSLAADCGHRAVGVILSGTASDGTLGLEAIQAEGGVTFAQDSASARFDSMPRSAATAGAVDFVLPPEGIAEGLARLARDPYLLEPPPDAGTTAQTAQTALQSAGIAALPSDTSPPPPDPHAAPSGDDVSFKRVLGLLHSAHGVDFALYRLTTIQRRITRRMLLKNVSSLEHFAQMLQDHPEELEALYQDLLIGVTSFFRDPDTYEFLQRTVFPSLVKNRAANETLRVWVCGCSTGQEAYSLAMVYLEFAGWAGVHVPLQIFATDLNERRLERARAGLYSKALTNDITPERLGRFFTEANGGYRINKEVRESVVFSRHNVLADPPFSKMDLVSCRNLLIYLEPSLQSQVIPTFHYALKPTGVLVLGASETVGRHTDLFKSLDKRLRVYTKQPAVSHPHRPARPTPAGAAPAPPRPAPSPHIAEGEIATREADRLLLARYAPSGVIVDDALEVQQFRGATGRYLEAASGKASLNLLSMARTGLMLPLRALIERAKTERRAVRTENVRFRYDEQSMLVHLEVVPLGESGRWMVLFEPPTAVSRVGAARPRRPRAEPSEDAARVAELTLENEDLQRLIIETRAYLQLVQERNEAIVEDLQTSNEEVQSANEELQSLIEELETSKEELSSSNEEMRTINEELSGRNAELRQLDNDHVNFQASVELAIVSLDRDARVQRFTPQATQTLGVESSNLGSPVARLRHGLEGIDLEALVREVIRDATPLEREVRDRRDGRWWLLRVRPYRTHDARTDGAVLVLFDIDAMKRAELERQAAAAALQRANEKLTEVGEAQRRFLADAAHELRAPLAIIQGNLEILERYPDMPDTDRRKAVDDSLTAARQLSQLANDLLSLARGDAGDKLHLEALDLAPLLAKTVQEAQRLNDGRILETGVLEACAVQGDRGRLRQLALILLDNALKYTPKGGRVTLSLRATHEWAELSVTDTGAGIAGEDLERVFERFFRTDASRSRETGGTGLGLPIARWIAEQHGGKVWLESKLGKGTTAVVRLPLAIPKAHAP
ncbi:MAG: chemotaxis protein CheB [Meiothermus sp.]|nr:chemotaxis protein CheB [Meiothermus sp.]